jgi:hypothetical protein
MTAVSITAPIPVASDGGTADRPSAPPAPRDGVHDFDFLFGTWRVHNRRLRRRLAGSTEWYEFEGTLSARPIWDGQANIDEYDGDSPDGRIRGLTLRIYNPRSRQWTIHWSNSATGTLDEAMTGEFRDGRGEFYNQELFEGRAIYVRFVWTPSSPTQARWEQAFSADGGKTWETNWIMDFTRVSYTTGARADALAAECTTCCPIVELRQYALHPGQRETLISLFEKKFIESQEHAGIRLIAQFRDIDRPNVFTWLRGFPSMIARATSLAKFYNGPVWAANCDAANATMIDSDNVRLLRPAGNTSGFFLEGDRPGLGATAIPAGLVVATIYTLSASAAEGFADFFERMMAPRLTAYGARPFAVFETEPSENTFPRLPVRTGEHAFVWFASFADVAVYERHKAALAADRRWTEEVHPALDHRLSAPVEVWRLTPTARSYVLR